MVSIGVSCDDDPGAILSLVFFLAEALVAGDTVVAGDFNSEAGSDVSVAGADSGAGSGVETGSDSGSGLFAGEALSDLVSPALGGFLFSGSLRPSLHQFWDDQWF